MGDYEKAGINADKAISGGAILMDFNDKTFISETTTFPFPSYGLKNPEILFYGSRQSPIAGYDIVNIDSALFKSYADNDLRKSIFYKVLDNGITFKGSYTGQSIVFSGLATNELYLIRAESYARENKFKEAMSDLNELLQKRYLSGKFIPLTASNAEEALKIILTERRKELPVTGNVRWEDLRRLNLDPKFQTTITHIIEGVKYTLPPNDLRYIFPIPANEIQLSGITQNPR